MIQSIQPHPQLRNIVKEYYLIDKKLSGASEEIPVIDDYCHDLVVFKEQRAHLQYGTKEKTVPINAKVFTILGLEPPYVLKVRDHLTFFTIKLQPWMNRYFCESMEPIGIVDIEDFHPDLKVIHEQLKGSSSMSQLVEKAYAMFLNQDIPLTSKMNLVKELCEFIIEEEGLVKVKDIALRFDKSRQYINKTFHQKVMCTLKTFITAVKIVALVKRKAKSVDVSLTHLSYDYGYFDQAHFINDFKKVCGVTPSQYFENLPEFILRHE